MISKIVRKSVVCKYWNLLLIMFLWLYLYYYQYTTKHSRKVSPNKRGSNFSDSFFDKSGVIFRSRKRCGKSLIFTVICSKKPIKNPLKNLQLFWTSSRRNSLFLTADNLKVISDLILLFNEVQHQIARRMYPNSSRLFGDILYGLHDSIKNMEVMFTWSRLALCYVGTIDPNAEVPSGVHPWARVDKWVCFSRLWLVPSTSSELGVRVVHQLLTKKGK